MIKLVDKKLSQRAEKQLAKYQQEVDDEATYELQVAKAKAKWKPKNKTFDEIMAVLIAMCPGTRRCCYCEDSLGTDIEHFKPKSLYPELTFVWSNYLLACSACNSQAKRDQFAIFDSGGIEHDITRLPKTPIVKPLVGVPLLINPRYENPLDFFRVELLRSFHIQPLRNLSTRDKRRADYSIDTLQLNRSELVEWRATAYINFVGWVHTYQHYKTKHPPSRLQKHEESLKSYTHLAVWEEMKRVYRNRDSRWDTLKSRFEVIQDLDDLFGKTPEVLSVAI